MSLTVAPNTAGEAVGYLYVDDGETHQYQKGESTIIRYQYKGNALTSRVIQAGYKAGGYYNKIIVMGITHAPKSVKYVLNKGEKPVEVEIMDYDEAMNAVFALLIDEQAPLMEEFTFTMEF